MLRTYCNYVGDDALGVPQTGTKTSSPHSLNQVPASLGQAMPAPTALTALPSLTYRKTKEVNQIKTITLEILETAPQGEISVTQGDNSHSIAVTLTRKGEIYIAHDSVFPVFAAVKPDGKVIFADCLMENGLITMALTEQHTAVNGPMRCQLRLYDNSGSLMICPRFTVNIFPAVAVDSEVLQSEDDISALKNMVTDGNTLLDTVRQSLDAGDFTPQFSVGTVSTLPAGSVAAVEISGEKSAPVLNFAIPQGEMGKAEEMISDTELSENSTRPVQNRVITAALNEKLSKSEFQQSSENFVKNEVFSETVSNFVELEDFGTLMETKVDKVSGLGLSSNDFTDEEKAKLAGIAENANNFTLEDGAVSTGKIADYAVSLSKLSSEAKSKGIAVTLSAAGWADNSQTVSAPGVTADNNIVVASAPENMEAYLDAGVYCSAQADGQLSFACGSLPAADMKANVVILV